MLICNPRRFGTWAHNRSKCFMVNSQLSKEIEAKWSQKLGKTVDSADRIASARISGPECSVADRFEDPNGNCLTSRWSWPTGHSGNWSWWNRLQTWLHRSWSLSGNRARMSNRHSSGISCISTAQSEKHLRIKCNYTDDEGLCLSSCTIGWERNTSILQLRAQHQPIQFLKSVYN